MARTSKKQVKDFILDVDGVLTTGQFLYTAGGKFAKVFGAHDADGIKLIRPYLDVCAITADKRGFEITKKRVADDMGLTLHLVPEEDRLVWFQKNFDLERCVFMGDGIFDAQVFHYVGYSIAPANAFYLAKERANYVTMAKSGEGAVAEACLHLIEKFFGPIDVKTLNVKKH
jgi:3-deoxy-D-manno-octulosonate 8-phosphate phosphatase (KDO 8-P phosphatase)